MICRLATLRSTIHIHISSRRDFISLTTILYDHYPDNTVTICLNNTAIAEEVPSRYDYDYLYLRYYLAVRGNQCKNQIQLQPNTKPIIYKYIMHMNSRPIHSTQEFNISATQIILHTPLTDRKRLLAEWRVTSVESTSEKNLQPNIITVTGIQRLTFSTSVPLGAY